MSDPMKNGHRIPDTLLSTMIVDISKFRLRSTGIWRGKLPPFDAQVLWWFWRFGVLVLTSDTNTDIASNI